MRFVLPLIGGAASLLSLSVMAATPPDAGQSQQNIDQRQLQLPGKQRLELNLPDAPSTEAKAGGPSLQV
ncbi:ShlB/FhaC/HecB family hemolysin secretion/activation protein, partial [Klebsiella pneumoniae]|nr:ShlB/FhaC/HecB family hemolysin secretion/activation protein [Klebsiella pneumoniae]